MKKIFSTLFTILLLMCVAVPARADFAVTSITLSANDLDASAFFPVLDNYKRQCALIKVQVDPPQGGFLFETGALGVEKVVEKLPEIWVYVPEKTMKIKIMHPKLGVISNSQNNDGYYWFHDKVGKLESGRVYVLKLALNKQVIENIIDVRKESGYLMLNTVPEGAEVYLGPEGGKLEYEDVTPFSKKLEYGRYNFRVTKAKYHGDFGLAIIDKPQVEFDLQLKPAFGSIEVTSTPAGAQVFLDGENTGKVTPCTLTEVDSGEHDVRVTMRKYSPQSSTVTVSDGQTTSVALTMASRFAQVTVSTLPGASIKVNGEAKGVGSFTENLMEGLYDIEVTLASHRPATKQIEVEAGVPQSIELSPTPIYGSLDVESKPMKANITINGKNYGYTPITINDLLIGEYDVVLSKEGCATVTEHVTISENSTAAINATLQSGITPKWSKDITPEQKEIISRLIDNMVKVEGGTFTMGATSEQGGDADSDEKPAHQVTLSNFFIGKYEVTQEEWQAVIGRNPSRFKGSNKPVEKVCWNECQYFIRALNLLTGLNFSLPTEAQWEYAARGGNRSKGYKYSGSNNVDDVAWHSGNSKTNGEKQTHEVGTMMPNELGLYDMSGNVWEWCSDWYGSYSSGSQTNPTGPYSGSAHVLRGGSWYNIAGSCRVSGRNDYSPDIRGSNTGLRLALNIAE